MTGEERFNELYDEMENLVYHLNLSFQYGRQYPDIKDGRGVDENVLISRAKAIEDVADEMRYLRKFRGSLGLVTR